MISVYHPDGRHLNDLDADPGPEVLKLSIDLLVREAQFIGPDDPIPWPENLQSGVVEITLLKIEGRWTVPGDLPEETIDKFAWPPAERLEKAGKRIAAGLQRVERMEAAGTMPQDVARDEKRRLLEAWDEARNADGILAKALDRQADIERPPLRLQSRLRRWVVGSLDRTLSVLGLTRRSNLPEEWR